MNESKLNPVFQAIRKALPLQLLMLPLVSLTIPLNPNRVIYGEGSPSGLRWLHTASSIPEAEMLQQVLIAEGFHIEYVPSTATGAFGTTGNTNIYVPEREYAQAAEFLKAYLNPPPESEGENPPPDSAGY